MVPSVTRATAICEGGYFLGGVVSVEQLLSGQTEGKAEN